MTDSSDLGHNEQRQVRIAKLDLLREAGLRPYADRFPTTHTLAKTYSAAQKQSEPDRAEGSEVRVAGRVMTVRVFGKLLFLHLQDGSGRCQVALDRGVIGKESLDLFRRVVDLGDHVGIVGGTGRTKKGEPTIWASEWTFLSKALLPLPEKWHGLADVETRQRERYLDLATNEATRERFRFRTRFIRELRRYLDDHDFQEVDTPILQTKKTGALARPFHTHHNALDMECVLRIAPETWLKQCVAGGMDRVYEVARCFRNEGMDPSHLQDFSMCEWYAAYWDFRDNMDFTEGLILHLLDTLLGTRRVEFESRAIDFSPPWPRLSFRELIQRDADLDYEEYPDAASLRDAIRGKGIQLERDDLENLGRGTLIDLLYKKVSRPKLIDPAFVTGHPIDLSPLARRSDDLPRQTDRYQLVVNTWEVVNAYSELIDPIDQRERFESQAATKQAGDEEALEVDEEYLRAMEHGMPPMSGWGMGIERFLALLTGQDNLRDVVLFPLMKPLTLGSGGDVGSPTAADDARGATGDAGQEELADDYRELLGGAADDVDEFGIDPGRTQQLADEWVETESRRRAMDLAGKVMAALAQRDGRDPAAWRAIGLLHLLDHDRVEEPKRRGLVAAEALRTEGVHPAAIHALCAHRDDLLAHTGVRCRSRLDHALSASAEVAGLIAACTQVLPSKNVGDVKLKSLKKKFKDKKFASGVDRGRIERCRGVGLETDEFLALALEACQAANQ